MDDEQPIPIEKEGMSYMLTKQLVGDYFTISLMDENEEESDPIRYNGNFQQAFGEQSRRL